MAMARLAKLYPKIMRTRITIWIFIIATGGFLFLNNNTFAHPGRTDSYGCHTCRTNCSSWGLSYGEYHCHRAKDLPQPEPPIKSHSDGTTEPAPEYESPIPKNNNVLNTNNLNGQVSNNKEDDSFWNWVIGLGIAGIIGYSIYKKIKK